MPHDQWMALINSIPLALSGDLNQAAHTLHQVLGSVGRLCNAKGVILWQTLPIAAHPTKYMLFWHTSDGKPALITISAELEAIGQTVAAGLLLPSTITRDDNPTLAPFLTKLGQPSARLFPIWNTEATPTLWGFMAIGATPTDDDLYLTSVARQVAALLTAAVHNDTRDRTHTAISLTYEIASVFIHERAWTTQILNALNLLCQRLNVSRAYGYRFCDSEAQVLGVGFEARRHDNLPTVADSSLATLQRPALELDADRRYLCGQPEDMPPALGDMLQANGILFYVLIPIIWDDRWTGCLVLDDLEKEHTPWSTAGINALFTIGDLLMGALAREETRQSREDMFNLLENRNAALQIFNGLVAHDIKAPLRQINGELGRINPVTLHDHVASIRVQIDSLENMIKRLEVLSKSHLPHRPNLVELQVAFLDAMMRLQAIITKRHVEVITPTPWPLVMGQTEWMTEVFYNLVLNATQSFPPDHPNPLITISEAPTTDVNFIQLIIHDNSVGITPERRDKITKIFESQHPVYDNEGLGLTLVHVLMTQMGGRVGVTSTSGAGTTFWLLLPNATTEQRRAYNG